MKYSCYLLVDTLYESKKFSSKSDIRRLIKQNALKVGLETPEFSFPDDMEVVTDVNTLLVAGTWIVQYGKGKFLRLLLPQVNEL